MLRRSVAGSNTNAHMHILTDHVTCSISYPRTSHTKAVHIWNFVHMYRFAFTAILESVQSGVPIIEPFNEQSLNRPSGPSQGVPQTSSAFTIATRGLHFQMSILEYYRVTLCIVSLHSSVCKRASWAQPYLFVFDSYLKSQEYIT